MMKNKKNDYVLYGIIAALLTLLLGFGVLYLLWNLIGGDKELPGLFFYKAATYGDAICLTVLIGSMTAFVKYNEDVLLNKKLKCLIVAIICGLIGIIIQASWLISDTTLLNWTIPKQHYFNIAGWYHSLFFVGMFSVIGYLVSRIWFIVREKSSYIFIEKALMVLITSSSALYLLCHMEDDYYELVSNGISYGIVAVATIVIISCLFVNRFVKFSNVKIVIIDGLILAIGLYHSIVTRAFGNVSLSLAGAFSMIVYSGRDNVNLKKYILTNIPMFIGSFGIFFYITGCDNLAAKIGLAVVFIILLLIFDYNIIQGEKLNAIGILVSLYIVLFVIITNKDFLEIAPSVFTILMSLLFSKGIKNVFDDIIKAEQKKNRNLITNKEFKSIKMLAYIEIVSLVVSLILILWDWLKDIAIANNVDINWGELYIKNTSIVIVLIGIATMLLLGVRLVKSRIGIIVSLFVLVCEYLIILLNCYNNITNINFVDMSLITICVSIFAIFANVGGGLLLSHGFRMNVATLRLKPITRPINLISRIMGIGAFGVSYSTTIIIAVNPTIFEIISSLIMVLIAYFVIPLIYAKAYRMDKFDKSNDVIPNKSLGGVAQDSFMIVLIVLCASYLPTIFCGVMKFNSTSLQSIIAEVAMVAALLITAFIPVIFCIQNNRNHLVRQRIVAEENNRMEVWEILRKEILVQSGQTCVAMLPYIIIVFVEMEIERYLKNSNTGNLKKELKAFKVKFIEVDNYDTAVRNLESD